jgi:hypothetical protein
MSRMIEIAAEAERPEMGAGGGFRGRRRNMKEKPSADKMGAERVSAHQFPAESGEGDTGST